MSNLKLSKRTARALLSEIAEMKKEQEERRNGRAPDPNLESAMVLAGLLGTLQYFADPEESRKRIYAEIDERARQRAELEKQQR
jgi:hypothetical protein